MLRQLLRIVLTTILILTSLIFSMRLVNAEGSTYLPQPASRKELKSIQQNMTIRSDDSLIFSIMAFDTQKEAEDFVEMMRSQEKMQDEVSFVVSNIGEDIVVRANYTQDASMDAPKILYYAALGEDSIEAVERFIAQELLLFPDLIQGGSVIPSTSTEQEEKYDATFAIRPRVNARALFYNPDTEHLDYFDERRPFTYSLEEEETDKIQEAHETIFPGQFTFTEEVDEQGVRKITMERASQESSDVADEGIALSVQEVETEVYNENAPDWLIKVFDNEWVDMLLANQRLLNIISGFVILLALVLIIGGIRRR